MRHLHDLWHRVPPSLRFRLRDQAAQLAEHGRRARLWRWNASTFASPRGVHGHVAYLGRREATHSAEEAFGDQESNGGLTSSLNGISVSELPVPGALKVPHTLRMMIDCHGTLDQIVRRGSHGAWRHVLPAVGACSIAPVTDDIEIARISEQLLEPYAAARHGEEAVQVPLGTVRSLAQHGGLCALYYRGKELAVRLSYEYEHDGIRTFAAWRFGFPPHVYEDRGRYALANGLNTYFSIRHAVESGFTMMDFGLSPSHPFDNGPMKFKRMHAAAVSAVNIHEFFYVRTPASQRAWFLWVRPLFSVERGQVVLNAGVPAELGDAELIARVKSEMVIRGVSRVRLHSERKLPWRVLEQVRAAFTLGKRAAPSDRTPVIEVAPVWE
ncbi:MAG: hypothetical protein QM723_10765 [Myxococcaceae bacterium]